MIHYLFKITVQWNLSFEKVSANPTALLPGDIGLPAVYFGTAGVDISRLFDLSYSFNILQRVSLSDLPFGLSSASFDDDSSAVLPKVCTNLRLLFYVFMDRDFGCFLVRWFVILSDIMQP